jgi:hypothetical protein
MPSEPCEGENIVTLGIGIAPRLGPWADHVLKTKPRQAKCSVRPQEAIVNQHLPSKLGPFMKKQSRANLIA